MAKSPIIGYIVLRRNDANNGALELCEGHDYPQGGILLWGLSATVFTNRGRAQTAIFRTMRYFNRPVAQGGLEEPIPNKDFQIQPLRRQQ